MKVHVDELIISQYFFISTGIPRFMLLMWGLKKKPRMQKPRKSWLLSSTKGEENRIEL